MFTPHWLHRAFAVAVIALLMTHCLGQSTQGGDGTSTTDTHGTGSGGTGAAPPNCWEAEVLEFHDPAFERGVLNSLERTDGPVTGAEAQEVSHITVVGATSLEDVECLPSVVLWRISNDVIRGYIARAA